MSSVEGTGARTIRHVGEGEVGRGRRNSMSKKGGGGEIA